MSNNNCLSVSDYNQRAVAGCIGISLLGQRFCKSLVKLSNVVLVILQVSHYHNTTIPVIYYLFKTSLGIETQSPVPSPSFETFVIANDSVSPTTIENSTSLTENSTSPTATGHSLPPEPIIPNETHVAG